MMNSCFFYVVTFILLKGVSSIVVEDCGSTWKVESADLLGCPEEIDECEVTINTNISVSIQASNVTPFISLNSSAYIFIMGSTVPLAVTPELCDQWPCPFNSVGDLFYNATVEIVPKFPNISGKLYLEGKFKDSELKAFCISIPIRIKRTK